MVCWSVIFVLGQESRGGADCIKMRLYYDVLAQLLRCTIARHVLFVCKYFIAYCRGALQAIICYLG